MLTTCFLVHCWLLKSSYNFRGFFVKTQCESCFGEITVCWQLKKQSSYAKISKGEKEQPVNSQLHMPFLLSYFAGEGDSST